MTPEQHKRFKHWQMRTIVATMVGYALFYFVRFHGLSHKVSRLIGIETIDPAYQLPLGLRFEMGLPVEGPAHQPGRVLHCDDPAGYYLACVRVPSADILDVRYDPVIQQSDGGRLPLGGLDVRAEFFRPAKEGILHGEVFPQGAACVPELRAFGDSSNSKQPHLVV